MGAGRLISPLLITAGPTHEPLDAVRYIGNRSSGRLGVALALEAVRRGIETTLLLGPTCHDTSTLLHQMQDAAPGGVAHAVQRFCSTADLERLLDAAWPGRYGCLVMAAAVADYRLPVHGDGGSVVPTVKLRRSREGLHLDLEATPDLVAGCARRKRAGQTVVAFALEDAIGLVEAAREKMDRKGVDAIVANPLGTMEASTVQGATLLWATGCGGQVAYADGDGAMEKEAFAGWLLDRLVESL